MSVQQIFAPEKTALPSLTAATPLTNPATGIHSVLAEGDQTGYIIQQHVKRLVDIVLVVLGLILISPVLIILALLIKFTSRGPILYKSLRIGKHYQPFYMYKFRTMTVDADQQRDKLRQQANLQGNLFKLENDPRVTPVGRLLREFSLDELPQLLNVLKGEMSLVGPRPLPPDESNLFEGPYTMRYDVLPGITGAWQVGGRSKLNFKQLCELELGYVINWSIFKDFEILFKTLPAVLMKNGAY